MSWRLASVRPRGPYTGLQKMELIHVITYKVIEVADLGEARIFTMRGPPNNKLSPELSMRVIKDGILRSARIEDR